MKPIPYGRQCIEQDDIDAVVKTLTSDFLTQGPQVDAFEEEFSRYFGSKHAIALSNGTTALHLAALALGVCPGDRVLCVSNTFVASANCVLYCGGEIEFLDIDPQTYCLDIEKFRLKLESAPTGTYKGVVVVDFAGFGLQMDKISNIAKAHGLFVIEDVCHAPGATFKAEDGRVVKNGSGEFADISVFSFHPVKHIATAEGGMITTNRDDLAATIRLLRTHGINRDPAKMRKIAYGGWYYEMQSLGYNYRIPDVLCALGRTQLAKLDRSLQLRAEIAAHYDSAFKGTSIITPHKIADLCHAYHLYVIQVEDRFGLYNYLREYGVYAQVHYIPVHQQPYYVERYGEVTLPETDLYYSKTLSLPMFPSLSRSDQDFVISKVKDFLLL